MNDSSVSCQNRDLARPQAGQILPSQPLKEVLHKVWYPFSFVHKTSEKDLNGSGNE